MPTSSHDVSGARYFRLSVPKKAESSSSSRSSDLDIDGRAGDQGMAGRIRPMKVDFPSIFERAIRRTR